METRLSERVLLLSHAGMRRRRRVQRQTQQPTTTAPYERVPCANGKAFRASLDNMRRNAKCQHVPHGRAQPSSNMHACNSAAPHAHPASTRVHSRIVEKHTHTHTHTGRTYWCLLLEACVFSTACVKTEEGDLFYLVPRPRRVSRRSEWRVLEFIKLLAGHFRKRVIPAPSMSLLTRCYENSTSAR